jgi:hypothetical protein
MGVGGDQLDAGQAAGDQVAQEGQPAGAILSRTHLEAEDLAVPVAVHAGRHQGVHVDHPTALADLEHQRVCGEERVRAGVQQAGPERLDLPSSSAAITDTCDLDSRVMPSDSTRRSIRRVDTPSR